MRHESKQGRWRHSAGIIVPIVLLGSARILAAQLSLEQALLLQSHGVLSQADSDTPLAAAPVTTEAALRALADQAAIIFRGEVLSIQTGDDSVRIDLRVDDGIRGVVTGQTYSLREWSGLWVAGAQRYHVGQRALFLLHQPSAGGFSSPVGGSDGVIPLAGDEVRSAVDLRWVAARVARSVATRPDNAPDGGAYGSGTVYSARGAIAATAAHQASAAANGVAWPAEASSGNVLGPDLHSIDSNLVAGLLRAWSPAPAGTMAESR